MKIKSIESSSLEELRDFFNVGKVKRLFRVGAEVFSAIAPFAEKPTVLNGAKAAFLVGKVLVDDLEVWPDDYFDSSWETPYPHDFNPLILRALEGKPYKVIKTSDETTVIHMVTLGGVRFGYVINLKTKFVERIYVQGDEVPAAKELVKRELWRAMKDNNIVLRRPRKPNERDERGVSLEIDDAFRPMPSRRAQEYAQYLKKCVDAGVSRSVLLYGPPGTGKSTMARTIIENLGMKSFRIRVEDIGHFEVSSLFEAISIFEPDAVILDDFDRSNEQASLLETLEYFQRHVKLVIATVNNKNRLDEAILRPGRFDELVCIKQMDEDVVKAVLGPEHADAIELVKDWPIAFIQEYVKRLRFMSPDEAADSVKELAARVKRLSKYDEEDPETEAIDAVIEPPRKDATEVFEDFMMAASREGKRKGRRGHK